MARATSLERRAQQLIAGCFAALAVYLLYDGIRTLAGGSHPTVSWLGVAVSTGAIIVMPLLARAKNRVAAQLDSGAVSGDAVSSIGGRVVGPTFGAYAASKFALEAVSDALRREVVRLGVQVIVIEPGTVATGIWGKGLAAAQELAARMSEAQQTRYRDLLAAVSKQAETLARSGIDPADAARVIADAVEARKPRVRYLVGRDAKLMARVAGVLPDRIVDRLIARNLGLGEPAATSAAAARSDPASELAVR